MKLRLPKRMLALALCTMLGMGGMLDVAADIVLAQGMTATEQSTTGAGGATVTGSDRGASLTEQPIGLEGIGL